jgi:hypothetical protein
LKFLGIHFINLQENMPPLSNKLLLILSFVHIWSVHHLSFFKKFNKSTTDSLLFAQAQFMEGTSQYNYFVDLGKKKLAAQTQYHPDLVDTFFPELKLLPRDDYRDEKPIVSSTVFGAGQDYVINLIFDPCRGHSHDCCNGLYGTPEYIKLENTTSQISLDRFGATFGTIRSRLQDRLLILDEVCTGKEKPFRVIDSCLGCLDPPYAGYPDQIESTVLPMDRCPDAVRKHCAVNSGIYSSNIIDVDLIDRDTVTTVATQATDMYTSMFNGQKRDFQILCRVMSTRCKYDPNRKCKESPLGQPNGCRYCQNNYAAGQEGDPIDTCLSDSDCPGTNKCIDAAWRQGDIRDAAGAPLRDYSAANEAAGIPTWKGCEQKSIDQCKGQPVLDDKFRDTGRWHGLNPPCITTCRQIDIWRRDCVRPRVSFVQEQFRPRCWDYNETVPADQDCYDVAGIRLPYCVQMAFTLDAAVFQCSGYQGSGPYANDAHCGTFIEIHLPNITAKDSDGKLYQRYSNEQIREVLIDIKVPEGMSSGYNTVVLETQFKKIPSQILCAGPYQVWWVQRTLYDFVIEFRSTFAVVSPSCDWDADNKRYQPFKVLSVAEQAVATNKKKAAAEIRAINAAAAAKAAAQAAAAEAAAAAAAAAAATEDEDT